MYIKENPDLGLREIYVNLKNYDFDVHGQYRMDKKEADKFISSYEEKEKAKDAGIDEKYRLAVQTLQGIAQRSGEYKNGGDDELSEANSFCDCRRAAIKTLKKIGEQTTMENKRTKEEREKHEVE